MSRRQDDIPEAGAMSRRAFLAAGAALGVAATLGAQCVRAAEPAREASGLHALPKLPYPENALEPYIDAETMGIHHGKHHAAYVKNLNDALAGEPELKTLPIEALLAADAGKVPEAVRQSVINNGGGHHNHTLFWSVLGPKNAVTPAPEGKLAEAIQAAFGGLDLLKKQMNEAGMKRFGSGWSWLAKNPQGRLEILSTSNQDSPLMKGLTPIFGIDVWEHAYYLKYRNLRKDYLDAIWNVVNWKEVERRFS